MPSNDFGTVNVKRGDRTREIDILRQRYNRHRDALTSLAADAPSEHLATEYARLIRELDMAIGKLGELEGMRPSDTQPLKATQPGTTQPGTRPLVTPPGMIMPDASDSDTSSTALPRVALIIGAGILVLALIFWLMWRAGGERPATTSTAPKTETAVVTEAKPTPVTPAPRPVIAPLKVDPASQDYGTIRKGTRAVRQFQVSNNGDAAITLQVARSTCRCLYYDYSSTIPARGKETVTVTVDGAKAKRGTLHETVSISTKENPNATASFDVVAAIR